MTRDEALKLKFGDKLRPSPIWNDSERLVSRKLPEECVVVDLRRCVSQTGVMVTVLSERGWRLDLDAGWFERVEK